VTRPRKRWPAEAQVFEVARPHRAAGTIVEWVGLCGFCGDRMCSTGLLVVQAEGEPIVRLIHSRELLPLTRAAREVLRGLR
jgi:hypothetical protein